MQRIISKLVYHLTDVRDKIKYETDHIKKSIFLSRFRDNKAVFEHFYRNNIWGDNESVSGEGSTITYTERLRTDLPRVIERYRVVSMLDAPCGDYNWFRLIKLPDGTRYIGADIVEELIALNTKVYKSENIRFLCLDLTKDKLPDVDMWFCRDCLFHLSNTDIHKALYNFLNSDIKYLMTSSHPKCHRNKDISTGDFRLLNLLEKPFNFPEPLYQIDDYINGYPERIMGLWTKEMINKSLL